MPTTPITHHLLSLGLAALVTLGVLGGLDSLALSQSQPDAAAMLAVTNPLPNTL